MSESAAAASSSSSAAAAASASSAAAGGEGGNKKARTLEGVMADPWFKQGVALTKARQYDEAMEFLGKLVAAV